jgi:transposase
LYTEQIKRQIEYLHSEGHSSRAIAKLLKISKSGINDYLSRNDVSGAHFRYEFINSKETNLETSIWYSLPEINIDSYVQPDNSRILVISDMHIPYHHPRMIDWLAGLKEKYNPTRIICMGDELDKHALSYHESSPDLYSAGHELEASKKVIKALHDMFPEMDILESNHGSLHLRKAMTAGIPKAYIKSYNEILGVSEGWQWHHDLIITLPNGQPCYFTHGKSQNGLRLSQNMAMNVVQGHHHSEFNISYWSNPLSLFWSMQVGCLVDDKSLAMAYNKLTMKRPIIGTGLIIDGKPVLETMEL